MNSVVRDLQAAGLISAAAAPDHNLKILYSLTPQAEELLTQAHAIVQGLENAFLVGLGEAKVQEMQEMMQNTLARLQRADASQETGTQPGRKKRAKPLSSYSASCRNCAADLGEIHPGATSNTVLAPCKPIAAIRCTARA